MQTREWALIAFTIMSQMSVGAFLVLGVVHFWAQRKANIEEADKLSTLALLAIGPVLFLGLIASLFHLGTPLNAPRAISNFGSSWLSREVILGVTFALVGGVFAFMQWRKVSTPQVRMIVALVAAVIGVVQVISMAMVYMLPTIPAWNTPVTPITFLVTTFLLGGLAIGSALAINYVMMTRRGGEQQKQAELVAGALRWIALLSVLMLGIEFVVAPLYLAYLAAGGTAAAASASILIDQNGVLLGLRFALVFLGAGLFGLFIYRQAMSGTKVAVIGNLAYAAFAFVLVAEVIGRYLFYASLVKVGI